MQIATYTDVMNNPHYALYKVNPGAIFSVAVKKLSTVPRLLLCTLLCAMNTFMANEDQIATL